MHPLVALLLFAVACALMQRRYLSEVYLDSAATTRPFPHVLVRMALAGFLHFGNPSSKHGVGGRALEVLQTARERVAACVGAEPTQVTFTSGASESNNSILKGVAELLPPEQRAIVATGVEHASVHEVLGRLADAGHDVRFVRVLRDGHLDYDHLASLTEQGGVGMACFMAVNNETGARTDIARVRGIVGPSVWLHVDATQLVGKEPVDVTAYPVNSLVFSGHKFNGPKGVGCIIMSTMLPHLRPLIDGGHQERGLRSGTENVAAIDGMSRALEDSIDLHRFHARRLRGVKAHLVGRLVDELGATVNGCAERGCPWITNVSLPGVDASRLVRALSERGVYVNTSSACNRMSKPSRVL